MAAGEDGNGYGGGIGIKGKRWALEMAGVGVGVAGWGTYGGGVCSQLYPW